MPRLNTLGYFALVFGSMIAGASAVHTLYDWKQETQAVLEPAGIISPTQSVDSAQPQQEHAENTNQ
jgi:hypothetical protein